MALYVDLLCGEPLVDPDQPTVELALLGSAEEYLPH